MVLCHGSLQQATRDWNWAIQSDSSTAQRMRELVLLQAIEKYSDTSLTLEGSGPELMTYQLGQQFMLT